MDQNQITIRSIEPNDASAFNALKKTIEAESPYMLYDKDENQTTDAQQESFIERVTSPNSASNLFVLDFHGDLVGFMALMGGQLNKKKHSREIAMGVLKSHTGKGLGKRLLTHAISFSKKTGITRLELTVISENMPAIGLYEKIGFNLEGIKKCSIRIGGRLLDERCYGLVLF